MKKALLLGLLFPFLVNAQTITTIAGTGTAGYSGNGGPAVQAQFYAPTGVAVDKQGNIYIADPGNNVVWKTNTAGIIEVVAGNTSSVYSGDGGQAIAAGIPDPAAVTLDDTGNLYITEEFDHIIRKVNTAGIITTFAGIYDTGFYRGDGVQATATTLYFPFGVAFDAAGNAYVADVGNERIRKINTSGIISTIAGTGYDAYSGDGGPATAAQLNSPESLAFDKVGNLYFADYSNNCIRKIDTSGIITTIAGNGNTRAGYAGDGGLATAALIDGPWAITVDTANNIYIADNGNDCIRKIDKAGIITTYAGNTETGYSGDGGPAASAKLNYPVEIACDAAGNVLIADRDNNVVRKVTNPPTGIPVVSGIGGFSIYPNPATHDITLKSSTIHSTAMVRICNVSGKVMQQQVLPFVSGTAQLHTDLPPGTYTLQAVDETGMVKVGKLVIE